MSLTRSIISALLLLMLAACSGEPPSAEAQLRAVIEAGEAAVEARDLGAAMEHVDPGYLDSKQRNRRQLRSLVATYLFRHPSIYVISQIDSIELVRPGQAKVVVFAGLAGSAQEAAGPLDGWRGNLLRFDLVFTRLEETEWQLRSADWRQATREDFTQN